MDVKNFLSRPYELDQEINLKLRHLANYRSLLDTSSSELSLTPHCSVPRNRALENLMAKVIDLEHEVDDLIDEYVDAREQVQQLIDTLPSTLERQILEDRYLLFMKWEEIANAVNYSLRSIHRVEQEALLSLTESWHIMAHDVT